MSPLTEQRRRTRPLVAILKTMAMAREPLNKYELQKQAKAARQSVYDWVPRMERLGWIEVDRVERSRVGLPVKYYKLTDLGLFRAAGVAADMSEDIRRRLGAKYEEYEVRSMRSRVIDIDRWIQVIREVVRSGKAAPDWEFKLEIKANKQGRVTYSVSSGFPLPKKRVRIRSS